MSLAPTLTTDRLLLEPLSLTHWEAYAASWADPRMTAYIGGEPRSRNVSWTKFTQGAGLWTLLGYGYWAFVDRASGSYLGVGGLAQFERGIELIKGYPEAGWALVPDAWSKGIATEAMVAALNWADEALGNPEIRCIIDPDNAQSFRVADKCGFERIAQVESDLGTSVVLSRKSA